MTLFWGLPFLGLMLSVALGPSLMPRLWHRRLGLGVAGWSLALLLPFAVIQGGAALRVLLEAALIGSYLPFVSLMFALSVAGGGVMLRGGPFGRPLGNMLLLGGGCLLAGAIGTLGASLVLIHPLLAGNAHRRRKFHLVLFFIALVGNAGGALSPLGPPLFLGLLEGVPFGWPLRHLGAPAGFLAGVLLLLFYGIDRYLAVREPGPPAFTPLRVRGWRNIGLIAVAVGSVALPHLWGVALCLAVAAASLLGTPASVRRENMWAAAPMIEVAKLFAGLFITMQPVIAMLRLGAAGPLAPLMARVVTPGDYFWVAGGLSAFLDNAPTYQLLFHMAGGDLARAGRVLGGIAAGSVFFGGLTYIGNAPNLLIQAIAAHRGVRMPGFFGYLGWAALLLLPLLWVMQRWFF